MTIDPFIPEDPRSAASVALTLARADDAWGRAAIEARDAVEKCNANPEGTPAYWLALDKLFAARRERDRLGTIVMRLRSAVLEAQETEKAQRAYAHRRQAASAEHQARVARERQRALERGEEPPPAAATSERPRCCCSPAPAKDACTGGGLRKLVQT
jgi:hypothetical protein